MHEYICKCEYMKFASSHLLVVATAVQEHPLTLPTTILTSPSFASLPIVLLSLSHWVVVGWELDCEMK